MKLTVFSFVLLSTIYSNQSFASVFCKSQEGIKNVLASDGWECRDEFLMGSSETTCFTGKRSEAIKTINKLKELGYFDGTDGEYITEAHFKGSNEISYLIVDEANEVSEKASLKRCDSDFFKK